MAAPANTPMMPRARVTLLLGNLSKVGNSRSAMALYTNMPADRESSALSKPSATFDSDWYEAPTPVPMATTNG